jgi:hypothetical protein
MTLNEWRTQVAKISYYTLEKILEITKGKVGYEDLYKAYYEATDK